MLEPSVTQLHVEQVLDLLVLSKRQLNNEQDSTCARNSVADPDPSEQYVFRPPDPLVRGTDTDPATVPDPSIIFWKQNLDSY